MQQLNNIVLILGIAQGFFLALLLRRRHWTLYANRMLAALMAMYGIILFNLLLQDVGFYAAYPKLWMLLSGLPLVTGPLHYLYARHLIHPGRRLRTTDLLHALPFFLYKLTELPLLFASDASMQQLLADVAGSGIPERFFWFNWSIIAQGTLYMGATLLMLQRHGRGLEQLASGADQLRLTWLRNITLLSMLAWLIFATEYVLYLSGIMLAERFGVSGLFGGVLVYVMGYMGLSRSEVLETPGAASSMEALSHFREEEEDADAPAYARSGLSAERADEAAARLRALLDDEHVYRESGLTLPALARRMDLSPHNLSEVINTRFGQNFFDLVNSCRVREVCERLSDPGARQFTILAIAFDAGFNSKTSFNTIFKRHTGMTPSAYRDARSKYAGD
ncbi:MAG: helix-turn-helix domain-containing protein [Bacteroidota bacterium]|nr:helix-turn-helix domain-containing protein [Bacteroidota bacterium]